jgi:hypothetical protein
MSGSNQAVPSGPSTNNLGVPSGGLSAVALPVGSTSVFSNLTAPSGGESARNDGGTPSYGVTLNCGASARNNFGYS